MESWQREHICAHLQNLLQTTNCNSLLISHLVSKGFFSTEDVDRLTTQTKSDQPKLFYEIIVTKHNSYDVLCETLHKTHQTGALNILLEGFTSNGISVPELNQGIRYIADIKEETTWNQLSDDLQRDVLSRSVDFQGSSFSLGDLCKNIQPEELFQDTMTGQVITDLLNYKPIKIINQSIPDPKSYYVQRCIKQNNVINTKVLDHPCNDVFLIKAVTWNDLMRLANGKPIDVSSSQVEELTVKLILLEHDDDFEKICEMTTNPVHVLEFRDDKLYWETTYGSLANLQEFTEEQDDEMNEAYFLEYCNHTSTPVLLSDTPGMGKSFLLENMARRLITLHPYRLVRFIVMRELVEQVSSSSVQVSGEIICKLIADKCSNHNFGKRLAYNMLISRDIQCELLFDGFDEVAKNHWEIAKEILQIINQEIQCHLYVTTRPHLKRELENLLSTLGFNLVPFDENSQIKFLVEYWADRGASCDEKVRDYAVKCLNSLQSNMTDFERNIAGIPLQCRLLAEIHLQDALKFCSARTSVLNYGLDCKILSVYQMYNKMMAMRFENYPHAIQRHMQLALEVVFPGWESKFGSVFENEEVPLDDIYRVGLVEKMDNDNFRFVHRTFAEYLVAWFVAQIFEVDNEHVLNTIGDFVFGTVFQTTSKSELLVSTILITNFKPIAYEEFNNPIVCYFINGIMKSFKTNKIYANLLIKESDLAQTFIASVVNDYVNIAKFLLLWRDTLKECNSPAELVLLAAKHSSVEIMKIVQELYGDLTLIEYSYDGLTPVHVAAIRGKFKMFVFLLNACGYLRLLKENSNKTKVLLQLCVITVADEEYVVNQKMEIVKLIGMEFPELLNEPTSEGYTPLLIPKIHFKLRKRLIEMGADVNVVNDKRQCFLHQAGNTYDSKEYLELVKLLNNRDFHHYNLADSDGSTPIMFAVSKMDLDAKALEILISEGINLNAVDNFGNSVLFHTIRGGRKGEFIHLLVQQGADVNYRNFDGTSVLHVAARYGNLDAINFLINEYQSIVKMVNEVDRISNTPLHLAFNKRTEEHERICEVLIEAGADLNAINLNGDIPIVSAFKMGTGIGIKLMEMVEKRGFDIRGVASECLKYLVANLNITTHDFVEVVEFLMERGGRLSVLDGEDARNLWDSQYVSSKGLLKAVKLNSRFIIEANSRGLLPINSKPNSVEEFYESIRELPGSYERVMICLLLSGQTKAFKTMRYIVGLENFEPIFSIPLPGIAELLENKEDDRVIVICTVEIELTVLRLKETLNEVFTVVEEEGINSVRSSDDLVVVKSASFTDKIFNKVKESGGKFVIVCEEGLGELGEEWGNKINVIKDYVDFQDLTEKWKNKVVQMVKGECPEEVIEWVKENRGVLGGSLLIDIMVQAGGGGIGLSGISVEPISKEFFDYFHTDLIVVSGIGVDELKEYCQLGQKVVEDCEWDIGEIVDYVNVKGYQGFRSICDKMSGGVQYIRCINGNFWYVTGTGRENWYEQFVLERQDCQNIPFCICTRHDFSRSRMISGFANWSRMMVTGSLVICIDSGNIAKVNFEGTLTFKKAVEVVARIVCGGEVGIRVLEEILEKCPERVILILDAADSEVWQELVSILRDGEVKVVLFEDGCFEGGINSAGQKVLDMGRLQEFWYAVRNVFEEVIPKVHWNTIGKDCICDLGSVLFWQDAFRYCNFSRDDYNIDVESVEDLFEQYFQIMNGMIECEVGDWEYLKHLAVECLFPGKFGSSIERDEELDKELVRVGVLVWDQNGELSFVYNSVAWYLVGLELKDMGVVYFETVLESLFEVEATKLIVSYDLNGEKEIATFRFKNMPLFVFIEDQLCRFVIRMGVSEELVHAVVNGNFACVCEEIVRSNVDAARFFNDKIVLIACLRGDVPLVKFVFETYEKYTGRDIKNVLLEDQINCLHAAARNSVNVVKYLLFERNFVNALKNPVMNNLLHVCVFATLHLNRKLIKERVKIIQLLIQNRLDLIDQLDTYKFTALQMDFVHVDLLKLLIELGADLYATSSSKLKRFTLLHCAAEYMRPEDYEKIVEFTLMYMRGKRGANIRICFNNEVLRNALEYFDVTTNTLQLFKSAGVDFNGKDKLGRSALHLVVKYQRSAAVISHLVKHGCDVNLRDNQNRTVLHYAAKHGNLSAIRFFIEMCDVNANDKRGCTPLHLAFCGKDSETTHEIVTLLVRHGANVNAVTGKRWLFGGGKTPLDFALERVESGDLDEITVDLLMELGAETK